MSAYDDYVADLHGRPQTLDRETYNRIYGWVDELPKPNPTAFIQGAINYGQFGNVSSISIDPRDGQIVLQRPGVELAAPAALTPEIARENASQGGPVVYYPPPPEPLAAIVEEVPVANGSYGFRADPRGAANLMGSYLALQVSRGGPLPGQPTGWTPAVNQSASGVAGVALAGVGSACALLTGTAKALCQAGVAIGTAVISSGKDDKTPGSSPSGGGGAPAALSGGGVPKGQIATPADVRAVLGLYGAAVTPFQIGNIGGRPILRCPIPGLVLGRDNLCYNRRDLRKDERKWAPGRRPPMTGAEAHMLVTVGLLKKKAKKLAALAGFATHARGGARPGGKRRK